MASITPKELLDNAASYLVTQGVGVINQNIFKGTMPGSPVKCILVTSSGGPRLQGDPVHRPRLQIMVRDENYPTGIVTADSIFKLLDHKVLIVGILRGRLRPENEPGMFTRDVNDRYLFPLNFSCVLNPA